MIPPDAPRPVLRVVSYDVDAVVEHEVTDVEELPDLVREQAVTWIDVRGLGDEDLLQRLGEIFSIHALALEDAVNAPQRPKAEVYRDHLLVITRMAWLRDAGHIDTEQVALLLGERSLLTIQARHEDPFAPVRERILRGIGPIRRQGPDYLAYALIDLVIDAYYPILETYGDHLETVEAEVVHAPTQATLARIHRAKRELLGLRRAIWPQREMVHALLRDESRFVTQTVRMYLRDCYDHCVQILDVTETYRELAGSFLEIYLTSISNRTNEVMKVLTIMASIFIPLTFIAGIYGMNFEHMPELHVRNAYPIVIALMVAIAVGMLGYFWWKGWFERPVETERPPSSDDSK